MNESDYIAGSRMAWLTMLSTCLRHLGYDTPDASAAKWAVEREEIALKVRELCEEFGDTDYTNELHLADVLDKHLGNHLKRSLPAKGRTTR